MAILRVQHAVPAFDAWRQAFEKDPVDRRGGGVLRYTVFRATTDPNLVMIDLEFRTVGEAEVFRQKLIQLWSGPGKAVMRNPEAWIVERVESVEL